MEPIDTYYLIEPDDLKWRPSNIQQASPERAPWPLAVFQLSSKDLVLEHRNREERRPGL